MSRQLTWKDGTRSLKFMRAPSAWTVPSCCQTLEDLGYLLMPAIDGLPGIATKHRKTLNSMLNGLQKGLTSR